MVKIFLNTILGIILIVIWLKFVDTGEILSIISKVEPKSLSLSLIFMFLSPSIRALRLKIFLHKVQRLALLDLVFLNGVAMMLNFFIPVRAGEIAKGIYLNTHYNLPLGKSVVWMFLDRFLDFLVVLFMTIALLAIIPTTLSITVITVITVILTLALLLTWFAVYKSDFTKKLIRFLSHLLIEKHIKIYFGRFSHFILDSFSIFKRHPRDILKLVVVTVLAYGVDAAVWYFTFISLGFPQGFLKMYLGQLLSALTYLIPAAPGYVGSAEASGLLILSGVFGIDTNLASAMTVLFHILSAIFILIFGLISVFSLKINLGVILKKALRKGN